MNDLVSQLLDLVGHGISKTATKDVSDGIQSLAKNENLDKLFDGIGNCEPQSLDNEIVNRDIASLLLQSVKFVAPCLKNEDLTANSAVKLYAILPNEQSGRHHLLSVLARRGSVFALQEYANLLATNPPELTEHVVPSIALLMQNSNVDYHVLFPRLLDALQHRSVAGVVLDFANFLARQGKMETHPAQNRASELTELLGSLAGQLGHREEAIKKHQNPSAENAKQVSESVSLAISLCDTVSLLNHEPAIGKLFQILELSHRRLRTEAAASLARLKEKAGIKSLVELAAEPLVRLRVLAYATELGIFDEIPDEHRSAVARAEAELTLLLSEPTQFGFPPARCELLDRRTQYWPGYDDPVDCFLFGFEYDFAEGALKNVGIVGPVAHCFSIDLSTLPPDDIYAIFAGWHVDHEDICLIDIDSANPGQQAEVAKFKRRLSDHGFHNVKPKYVGSFLGERLLIAEVKSPEGQTGHAIVDGEMKISFAVNMPAERCYDLFVGRCLLRAFN